MKALTIRQPHASLVALKVKRIETRSWATSYRGPLAIHAGKRMPQSMRASFVGDWLVGVSPTDTAWIWTLTNVLDNRTVPLPLGAVVATATLADVVPVENLIHEATAAKAERWGEGHYIVDLEGQRPYGDFTPGRFAWLFEDVKPTTERCPACWGGGMIYTGPGHQLDMPCPLPCTGFDTTGCERIPAKGRQGLWEWTP